MSASRTVLLKLTACGATIAAIAFAIVSLSPDGDVRSSDADVLDIGFKSRTQIFTETLKRLGHSDPEPYDLNGNVVYFSSTHADGSPLEIMARYQREFTGQGYNRKTYGVPTSDEGTQDDIQEGLLLGALVPIQVSEHHVIMASGSIRGEPRTPDELSGADAPASPEDFADLVTGHKWVEIMRTDDHDNRSLVISSWGDGVNPRTMVPGNRETDANTNPEHPACPGCTRAVGFDSLSGEKLYRQTAYTGGGSVETVATFYLDVLQRRGWTLTETSRAYEKVRRNVSFPGDEATLLQFTRRDETLMLLIYPDGRSTGVQLIQTD